MSTYSQGHHLGSAREQRGEIGRLRSAMSVAHVAPFLTAASSAQRSGPTPSAIPCLCTYFSYRGLHREEMLRRVGTRLSEVVQIKCMSATSNKQANGRGGGAVRTHARWPEPQLPASACGGRAPHASTPRPCCCRNSAGVGMGPSNSSSCASRAGRSSLASATSCCSRSSPPASCTALSAAAT